MATTHHSPKALTYSSAFSSWSPIAAFPLDELHELSAAVAVGNQLMDVAGEQVDAGQKAQGGVANVLVIPTDGGMLPGDRRQIGSDSLV